MPRVTDLLGASALIEPDHAPGAGRPGARRPHQGARHLPDEPRRAAAGARPRPTRASCSASRYSTQRGYGGTHPFAGEIRVGEVEVEFEAPELGFAVPLGRVELTECQMINQFTGSADTPAQFTRGYGLAFGRSERKAMSMSMVDRALRAEEFGERVVAPAQDEEFVLSHSDNVRGHRLRGAPEAAALRRLPGRAGAGAPPARRVPVAGGQKPEPVLTDLADLAEARA